MNTTELKDYLDNEEYQSLRTSRYIQLYPADTHSKWGMIIDSIPAGLYVVITRIKFCIGVSGYTPDVGDVHFYPYATLKHRFVTEEEALAGSTHGYRR